MSFPASPALSSPCPVSESILELRLDADRPLHASYCSGPLCVVSCSPLDLKCFDKQHSWPKGPSGLQGWPFTLSSVPLWTLIIMKLYVYVSPNYYEALKAKGCLICIEPWILAQCQTHGRSSINICVCIFFPFFTWNLVSPPIVQFRQVSQEAIWGWRASPDILWPPHLSSFCNGEHKNWTVLQGVIKVYAKKDLISISIKRHE